MPSPSADNTPPPPGAPLAAWLRHWLVWLLLGSYVVAALLPTPGIWLGRRRNIAQFLRDGHTHLRPGDVLLLYTDGVTEAHDADGNLFDIERLETALAELHALPTAEIRDGIVRQVQSWMGDRPPLDDISLVVIRYIG